MEEITNKLCKDERKVISHENNLITHSNKMPAVITFFVHGRKARINAIAHYIAAKNKSDLPPLSSPSQEHKYKAKPRMICR